MEPGRSPHRDRTTVIREPIPAPGTSGTDGLTDSATRRAVAPDLTVALCPAVQRTVVAVRALALLTAVAVR